MKLAFEMIPSEFISDTAFYDYKDLMSDALAKVNRLGAIVVLKDDEYFGVVDGRSIASHGTTRMPENYPVGKFAKHVPVIDAKDSIKKAIQTFYETSSKALPVMSEGEITGILKRTDILKSILSLHLLSDFKASDAMSTPVIAIDQEATLNKAKVAMRENGVNRLAVIDKGKLLGIITYRDIIRSMMSTDARKPELSSKNVTRLKVNDFTERDVYTVNIDDSIDQAIREMAKNNVSSLLVTKKGRPAGMLTMRDVFEAVVKNNNIPQRNIVLSGLSGNLREYEEDVMTALDTFAEKVDKFRDIKVDYISFNIKEIKGDKSRQYDLKARVGFVRGGTVSMGATGFNLERTMKVLTSKLYRAIETKNELVIAGRKV
jgi:CBS domain-containing protein